MKLTNNKTKIFITLAVWAAMVAAMFFYGFKVVDRSNEQTQDKLDDMNRELMVLQAERDSFVKAKQDLETLKGKSLQPEKFFSKDVTFVEEIRFLEQLASKTGVEMTLSGISGTTKTAPKAKTLSADIVTVPYSVSITGSFSQVEAFVQAMENLPFATQLSGISVNTLSDTQVGANMTGIFYLKK